MTDKPNDEKNSIDDEIEKLRVEKLEKIYEQYEPVKKPIENKNIIPQEIVYRIMNLEHLIDDIKNEVITFAHPSCFEDVKESKDEGALFVQCWTRSPETPAMWEVFAPNKQGIMIKQDRAAFDRWSKVMSILTVKERFFKPSTFNSYWRNIDYDYDTENNDTLTQLEQLFHKRKEYNYEEETRWVVDLSNLSWLPSYKKVGNSYIKYPKIINKYVNGRYIRLLQLPFSKIEWSTIISEIIIDPRADDHFFRYATDLLNACILVNEVDIKRSTFWEKSSELKETTNSEILQLYYYSKGREDLVIKNLRNNNSTDDLKLRLFALHDLLLFDRIPPVYENNLLKENDLNVLLNEKSDNIEYYLMSYSILLAMYSVYRPNCFIINETTQHLQSQALVKQMFFLVGKALSHRDLIEKSQDANFINGIIKFWQREQRGIGNSYFEIWRTAYLNLDIQINNTTSSFSFNKQQSPPVSYADLTISLSTRTFLQTIMKPYFDSIKEEPPKP